MDPNDQATIKRLADEHEGLVVSARCGRSGGASRSPPRQYRSAIRASSGHLAGVPLGLPVFHILEEDVKAQIDPDVWDEQIALLEVALDVDDIRESMTRVRERIDGAA